METFENCRVYNRPLIILSCAWFASYEAGYRVHSGSALNDSAFRTIFPSQGRTVFNQPFYDFANSGFAWHVLAQGKGALARHRNSPVVQGDSGIQVYPVFHGVMQHLRTGAALPNNRRVQESGHGRHKRLDTVDLSVGQESFAGRVPGAGAPDPPSLRALRALALARRVVHAERPR